MNPTPTRWSLLLVTISCLSATAGAQSHDEIANRIADEVRAEILRTQNLRESHADWTDPWIVETSHFRVRSLESWLLVHDLGQGLEQMHDRFEDLLAPSTPARPTRSPVFVLPSLADYQQFGDDHGDARSSIYGSFHATGHPDQPVATYRDANLTRLRMFVTHGATLQFLEQRFPNRGTPAWIDYGLASYFQIAWAYGYGISELQRLQDENQFIPLGLLLAIQVDGNSSSLTSANAHAHFVELGMLFWYLLHHREDTRTEPGASEPGPFASYLRSAVSGRNVAQHPVHALLFNDTAALESDLRSFVFPKIER